MSSPVIQVNNLSKSFVIAHEGREKYSTLRDAMTKKAKKIFSFPTSFRSAPVTKETFWALNDISFEINQGDRVGIIGRNGAGKSTLLKILSRITEPTTGQIKIMGRVASLLEVGTGFHPELTGSENIFLNGAILGMSRAEIRKHFDAIVDFAGIEKFLDTPVKRYSSGMYVRLAFAVAAHLEPEILIVDEVLAVGDAEFQKKCLGKMEEVSRNDGRTILFVSHNVPALRNLTEWIVYLKNGKIESTGGTSAMLEKYAEDNIQQAVENKDTDLYRRKERNPLATISAVTVNSIATEFPRIAIGGPVMLALIIDAVQEIENPDINVIIKNIDGEIVTTIASRDANFTTVLNKGENKVQFRIEKNCFSPGKYFGAIGVGPFSGALSFDVLIDYPLFEIYNDGRIQFWADRPFGNFIIDGINWS